MEEVKRRAAERVARRVSDLVGEGCFVRVLDPRGEHLCAAAVHHRDPERLATLRKLLDSPPLSLKDSWAGQVVAKRAAVRLRHTDARKVVGAGEGDEAPLAVVAAPLILEGRPAGVVTALRYGLDVPYGLREQLRVEELASDADMRRVSSPKRCEGAAEPGLAARVIEQAGAGIVVTDLERRVSYVNRAACHLIGAPSWTLVGRSLDAFVGAPDSDGTSLGWDGCWQDRQLVREDGTLTWASVGMMPLVDEYGCRSGTIFTLAAAESRKAAEIEFRLRAAADRELADLARIMLACESRDELARAAAAKTADLLDAELVSIGDVDETGTEYVPRGVVGWDEDVLGQRFELGPASRVRLCLEDRRTLVLGEGEAVPELFLGAPEGAGRTSAICAPIGESEGLLVAHSDRREAFSELDLSFVKSLTALLAPRWASGPHPLAEVGVC